MRIKTILFCVCLYFMFPGGLFAERMTDNWQLTGYTKYRDAIFADMDRLFSPTPGTTAVWIKIAPSVRSKYLQFINEYLQTVKKRDQGFKSIEILCEVNCRGHLIRFTKFVYLDTNRNVIHETYEARPEWMQIHQGSIWYPVEQAACPYKKQPAK